MLGNASQTGLVKNVITQITETKFLAFQAEILVCGTPYGDLQKLFFGSPMGAILDSSLDLNLVSRGSKSLKMVPGAYLG